VKRARRKIEEQIQAERQQLTPEAINATTVIIQHWLARHSSDRIDLKDRTIHRGAEASKSKFIIRLVHHLQSTGTIPVKKKQLSGRVTKGTVVC